MTATTNEPTISGERRIKMSYEDFLAWPEQGIQAEWVDGEMIIFMPPKNLHQATVDFILSAYRTVCRSSQPWYRTSCAARNACSSGCACA